LTRGGANLAFAGWADECNHWVRPDLRGRGIGTWLVAHAGAWLRLGGRSRMMAYAIENEQTEACAHYYSRYGLNPINRTTRGWQRPRHISRSAQPHQRG
jgi:GNAT superfamily N-acetyltransferase